MSELKPRWWADNDGVIVFLVGMDAYGRIHAHVKDQNPASYTHEQFMRRFVPAPDCTGFDWQPPMSLGKLAADCFGLPWEGSSDTYKNTNECRARRFLLAALGPREKWGDKLNDSWKDTSYEVGERCQKVAEAFLRNLGVPLD